MASGYYKYVMPTLICFYVKNVASVTCLYVDCVYEHTHMDTDGECA
jgi:hypothetical protein